jgi:hypothetical protein
MGTGSNFAIALIQHNLIPSLRRVSWCAALARNLRPNGQPRSGRAQHRRTALSRRLLWISGKRQARGNRKSGNPNERSDEEPYENPSYKMEPPSHSRLPPCAQRLPAMSSNCVSEPDIGDYSCVLRRSDGGPAAVGCQLLGEKPQSGSAMRAIPHCLSAGQSAGGASSSSIRRSKRRR